MDDPLNLITFQRLLENNKHEIKITRHEGKFHVNFCLEKL
jgi:hypothetical protein